MLSLLNRPPLPEIFLRLLLWTPALWLLKKAPVPPLMEKVVTLNLKVDPWRPSKEQNRGATWPSPHRRTPQKWDRENLPHRNPPTTPRET